MTEFGGVPLDIKNLLVDIEYICGLPEGFKLNLTNRTYSHIGLYESFYRFTHGECKQNTLAWLNNLIEKGINLARENPIHAQLVLGYMKRLTGPVNKLISVYTSHPIIVSELKIISTYLTDQYLTSVIGLNKPDRS